MYLYMYAERSNAFVEFIFFVTEGIQPNHDCLCLRAHACARIGKVEVEQSSGLSTFSVGRGPRYSVASPLPPWT
jgi:hypothetical protein